jgi:LCP family protein required for cell wall assembly
LPDVNPGSSRRREAAPYPADRAVSAAQVHRARTSADKSPIVGAFLSFVWPGLGELYAGARGRAAMFGLPTLAAIAWLGYMALRGLMRLAVDLFDTRFSSVLLVVIAITGLLRVASIVDTYRILAPARQTRSRNAPVAAGFLVVAALVAHGLAGYYAASFYSAGSQIFVGNGGGIAGGGIAGGGGAALPTPASASARINILLLGADSGMGYNHALTDSQILVSIDPATKTVVMASIPRDIAQFPMYNGGTYGGKINSLMSTALTDPAHYPDGGVGTLAREIGFLLGIRVNYYGFVNLAGFAKLIDTVGGVDVVNPKDIADAGYGFPGGQTGFFLSAGPHHLDSRLALAFVRTRQGIGDNDYTRAGRQQLVLQALRHQLATPAMVPKIPALLDALAQTIQTNFPVSRVADMMDLAQQVPDAAIKKYVLGPPFAVNPPTSTTGGIWILQLDMKVIRAWSVRVFGADSAYYVAPSPAPSGQRSQSPRTL